MMKKLSVFAAAVFCFQLLSAQSINGVWQNSWRLISFNNESATFVLKLFYGWYYDRAAILESVTQKKDGSWETVLTYPSIKKQQIYPLALSETELFLDFYIRGSAFLTQNTDDAQENSSLYGFWRSGGNKYEISIDESRDKTEVYGYFFTENHAYQIRYWLTDVAYAEVSASVVDGDFTFTADKFLRIGGQVYTCVTGRGTSIRNVQKLTYEIDGEGIVFSSPQNGKLPLYVSSDGNLMSFSAPYLLRADISDFNAEIIAMNARKRPPAKPFFPPVELDFYWDEIKKIRDGLGDTSVILNDFTLF